MKRWNHWIWDGGSWRVVASYPSQAEANKAARLSADPRDTYVVCKDGSVRDEIMRANCTERMANYNMFLRGARP